MAPNPPACSFIHTLMAGSRSTAPLKRSNSVLIVATLCFRDLWLGCTLAFPRAHAVRHTYRSWLDAVGTPIAVQQKLMRHAGIRTTMNTYGDVVTDEMARAASKVAGL